MSELLEHSQPALSHLHQLAELENAPRFNFESSDLLTSAALQDVRQFSSQLQTTTFWAQDQKPDWMSSYLTNVFREVPYYRELGGVPKLFESIPPIGRSDLGEHPELFVPDSVRLDQVTVYFTSGTTGSSLKIPTDAAVSSKVLVLIEQLLMGYGLRLPKGVGRVALAALFYQEKTLTYPTLSHYLQGAATLKLNLHPAAGWKSPQDRGKYLREVQPAIITGCPSSLSELADIVPELQITAILSSAVPMSQGLRERLVDVFGCPVIDVYSLTEAKFIAADQGKGYHDLLSPDLYVEILDEEGRVVSPGERGEICLTGGRNRCMPLLRYRTGDYAALKFRGRQPYLSGLQGRAPVALTKADGSALMSLDVVNAINDLDIVGFAYIQTAEGFRFEYVGPASEGEILSRLRGLSGRPGMVEKKLEWAGKRHAFRIEGA